MYDEQRAKKQLDWLKKRKKYVDKRESVKNKDRNDRRKAAQTPTRGVLSKPHTKEQSMNEIKNEIKNMESLMWELKDFGASDTEPDSVWHWILADTVNGKEPNVPSNGGGWQLFTLSMDCEDAANKLEVQAKRVVNLINEAPISKLNELREFLSDHCWRAQI